MGNKNEKNDRNGTIYKERKEGATVLELSEKYNLSMPRIHRICIKEENKSLRLENELLKAELAILKERTKNEK